MSAPHRQAPRIDPPCPVTVAMEEDGGKVLGYGVIFDISKIGGCIWTDVLLKVGGTVHLRLSFVDPPEVHTLVATVAWARRDSTAPGQNAYSCGLEWLGVGHALRGRLRQLVNLAVPGHEEERFLFERRWAVAAGSWPPPLGAVPWPPRRPGRGASSSRSVAFSPAVGNRHTHRGPSLEGAR